MFKFINYHFDPNTGLASFNYEGPTGVNYSETVQFTINNSIQYDATTLDQALFLAFIVLGTSYYKSHPTPEISLTYPLDDFQADFFNQIYQDGLSQFTFENHLKRSDLAHFKASEATSVPLPPSTLPANPTRLVLLSGGKDSLLTAEMLARDNLSFTPVYISNSDTDLPEIISAYGKPLVIKRHIDRKNLQKSAGLNGHVPVTLINESLALIQAILLDASEIYLGLGREGEEPHAYIDDLPINHQWSKTPATQQALRNYIQTHISNGITVKSLLENKDELEIAGDFVKLCWEKFGHQFSSCNVANYKQDTHNQALKWCGKCPKCANSFLLFAPYLPLTEQPFDHNLFTDPELTNTFKGLLGTENFMKPFECVGTTTELRTAYAKRNASYGDLPFIVPTA